MTASRPDDSFPYLHLSRRLCLPYGRVLAYVDLLDAPSSYYCEDYEKRRWTVAEAELLEEADMEKIVEVWRQEKARQARVTEQSRC